MNTKIVINNYSAEDLGLYKYRYVYTLEKCEVSIKKNVYTNKLRLIFTTNKSDTEMLMDHFGISAFNIDIPRNDPFDTKMFYNGKRMHLAEMQHRFENHTIDISMVKSSIIHNVYKDEDYFYHKAEEIYCE